MQTNDRSLAVRQDGPDWQDMDKYRMRALLMREMACSGEVLGAGPADSAHGAGSPGPSMRMATLRGKYVCNDLIYRMHLSKGHGHRPGPQVANSPSAVELFASR